MKIFKYKKANIEYKFHNLFHYILAFKIHSLAEIMQGYLRFQKECHRLQLSRNVWDRPGFVNFVPGPGRDYYLSRKITLTGKR